MDELARSKSNLLCSNLVTYVLVFHKVHKLCITTTAFSKPFLVFSSKFKLRRNKCLIMIICVFGSDHNS